MNLTKIIVAGLLLIGNGAFAQDYQEKDNLPFYATVSVEDAHKLLKSHPTKIKVLEETSTQAAVEIYPEVTELLKDGKLHGSGYVYKTSAKQALESIHRPLQKNNKAVNFTITEDDYVLSCIDLVDDENIGETILKLENYGTRFHTTNPGKQAALDLGEAWKQMVENANRSDVTVEFFTHQTTQQKSIIVTIPGSENPDDIVIIGGHLDSGDWWHQYDVPGADDNASGIAVLTESLRILLEKDFRPKKTVQIMAYAAEEVGLVGSAEIADSYYTQDKNVLGVVQFDMTNFNGSVDDIYFVNDAQYTDSSLTQYLGSLINHYNTTGNHVFTYDYTYCGYGCSDHVSWNNRDYPAAFPFESKFSETTPYYHTSNDTFASMNNDASHSAKFTKLALQFVIEAAKQDHQLSTATVNKNKSKIAVENKTLQYFLTKDFKKTNVQIFDVSGKKIFDKALKESSGKLNLSQLSSGVYVIVFKSNSGEVYNTKFLIK